MKSSAVVLLLGAFLLVGGAVAQASQAEEQNDQATPKPAKLVRKGAAAPAAAPEDSERGPAERVPVRDDAPPPVSFEQEPGHNHDQAAEKLDEELMNLVEQLLEGEGADAAEQQQHPLLSIGKRMRDAEARIAEVDAGRETQTIQTSIIKDLDALIDQLKQQASSCSNCNGAGCAQCQQLGSKRGQKPGQPNNSSKPGNNARANTAATQAVKNVWGHLPMRLREKLEQMSDEKFLPQYESLIEQYFKTLLERTDRPTNF
jgi:hypothetical protein